MNCGELAELAHADTFGPLFGVSHAEALTPDMASERAGKLANEFKEVFLDADTKVALVS